MLELLQKAGWVAYPLGIFSILALAIVLERLYTLSRIKQLEASAFEKLNTIAKRGEPLPAMDSSLEDAPVTQILKTLTGLQRSSDESKQTVVAVALSMQRLRLRKYLGLLATIGSTSPFIGLFGTVLGVLDSFQKMQIKGLGGQEMAGGIGEALSATAIGLAVAIPSVMAYNFFTGRVQSMVLEIHAHSAQLIAQEEANSGAGESPAGRGA